MTELQQLVNELSDEVKRERNAKEKAQNQYAETFTRLQEADYELTNFKKAFEEVRKTLERFEKENKALRELVSLWV